jgi:hypothetical protein
MTAALYEAISASSGKTVIVDSSKSPTRNLALLLNRRLDVRLIHLIRDGRGVVWSRSKSRSRDVEAGTPRDRLATPPWRSSLHWALRNLKSELVGKFAGGTRVVRISYETLVENPPEALKDVALLVDEDLTQLASALVVGEAMDVGHVVGGPTARRMPS